MKTNLAKNLDWAGLTRELDKEGYALLPGLLCKNEAQDLAALALHAATKSQQESLSALELGSGTQWRLPGRLPEPLATWQKYFYKMLSPIAMS